MKTRKARAVKAAKVSKPSKARVRSKKALSKSVGAVVAPAPISAAAKVTAKVATPAPVIAAPSVQTEAQPQVQDWIELFPSGIAIASEMGRPILILKDKNGDNVQPVWMHPVDAGVALAGLQDSTGLSPHIASKKILSAVGLKVDTCTFVELVGHHQYVQVQLRPAGENPRDTGVSFKVRADEVMSFCIQAGARFFSTKDMMTRCLRVNADMGTIEQGFAKGQLSALQNEMEISSKKNPYVM